ncbi:hypothetical protein M0813_14944 [Anaeramoeba flamelloides]|uniref:Uncharacterized protein n=1 Tax=Anaeramoeba flamelloides TaxID=1746091 RepID=A0AAV7Z6W8_9EUKA|nr:hypothetical protein M0812_18978 [Anaeramoeba flamelloides]KAJ6251502.1 hypothetical protein M0813_14944 [Anaeramoeba flamelloides]
MTLSAGNNKYGIYPNNLRKLFGLRTPEQPLFELIINHNNLQYFKKKRKKDYNHKKRTLLLLNKQKSLQKKGCLKKSKIAIQIPRKKRLDNESKNKINQQLREKLGNIDQEIDADIEQLLKNF